MGFVCLLPQVYKTLYNPPTTPWIHCVRGEVVEEDVVDIMLHCTTWSAPAIMLDERRPCH
jgi:hypothetical protein